MQDRAPVVGFHPGHYPSDYSNDYCSVMGDEDGVIALLAALGESFDVALAAEIAGLTPAELLLRLDTSQRDGVLSVEGGAVRFREGQAPGNIAASARTAGPRPTLGPRRS